MFGKLPKELFIEIKIVVALRQCLYTEELVTTSCDAVEVT
jgi:hypothetical protein